MGLGKSPYALGMRVLEAVERLVVIANNAERSLCAQKVDDRLFCLVQILILVDQDVLI
jgi:hypothetical protein